MARPAIQAIYWECDFRLGQSLQIVARRKPLYVCNAPDSDQILPRSGMTRRANSGHRVGGPLKNKEPAKLWRLILSTLIRLDLLPLS